MRLAGVKCIQDKNTDEVVCISCSEGAVQFHPISNLVHEAPHLGHRTSWCAVAPCASGELQASRAASVAEVSGGACSIRRATNSIECHVRGNLASLEHHGCMTLPSASTQQANAHHKLGNASAGPLLNFPNVRYRITSNLSLQYSAR